MKSMIYVANVAESDLASPENNPHVKNVMELASKLQSGLVTISAQVLKLCYIYPIKQSFLKIKK